MEENIIQDFPEEIKKDKEYLKYIEELLKCDAVISMKKFIQHGTTTTFDHCLHVSYSSYRLAKGLGLDERSVARAGLLHDLFLYDWHKQEKKPLFKKHGFTHSKIALENACKYFSLNDIEKDIIRKHMWPLTFRQLPKYKESLIVVWMDKYCSTKETFAPLLHSNKKTSETSKNYLH